MRRHPNFQSVRNDGGHSQDVESPITDTLYKETECRSAFDNILFPYAELRKNSVYYVLRCGFSRYLPQ